MTLGVQMLQYIKHVQGDDKIWNIKEIHMEYRVASNGHGQIY